MKRRSIWIGSLVVVAIAVTTWLLTSSPSRSATPPNILLVTVDTLRADHTSLHGYVRPTTPKLDEYFDEGVRYDHAYSATSKTASSVFSILTGLYPQNHGVRLQFQKVHPDLVTLSQRLSDAGYQTAAVISNSVLAREATGLDEHFDYYDDFVDQKEEYRNYYERGARGTTEAALKWLAGEREEGKPVFLWVHYMDPHGPYHPPDDKPTDFEHEIPVRIEYDRIQGYVQEPGNNDGMDYIDRYDEETAYFDEGAGKVLAAWQELGLQEGSLVVFTADHGETMMDHKKWFRHSYHAFEELVHVPLAIRGTGFPSGVRVDERVTNIAIAPTIMKAAGIELPANLDAGPLTAEPEARHIFVESFFTRRQWRGVLEANTSRKYMTLVTTKTDSPQYVRRRWYDLEADPYEQHKKPWPDEDDWTPGARALIDWIEADQDLGRELPRKYIGRGKKIGKPKKAPPGIAPDVDERQLEQLRALGYVE